MLSQSTFDRRGPSPVKAVKRFKSSRTTTSLSENKEERIALRNFTEPGNVGGTVCRRMDRKLLQ
jgi:hypothetical protein